ncbi:double-CXXCG motif protein [Pyxidicoccus sp. MSG2]|nr:double-CXXCG motif protein [Pyxidicoccus sp. MSG2]
MSRFYELTRAAAEGRWSATYRARRRWSLPGLETCPGCRATWSGGLAYPAVDLSELKEARELRKHRPAPFEEFSRLRELVRPYCPPGALLEPGTAFGPLEGSTRGKWGPLTLEMDDLLVREDALQVLLELRGIVPVWPHFRRPPSLRVAELQVLPRGRLHPDCLPPERSDPCAVCGRDDWHLPTHRWLDPTSLPDDLDVFRLEDAQTVVVVTERFADALSRLELSDVTLSPLGTSRPPGVKPLKRLDVSNAAIIIRR